MMKNYCIFCDEFASLEYKINFPIKHTKNFHLIADFAPVTTGHVLILPKAHLLSLSEIDEELRRELFNLIQYVFTTLKKEYANVVIGEHRATYAPLHGGSCFDHIHFHICPVKLDPQEGCKMISDFVGSQSAWLADFRESDGWPNGGYLAFGASASGLSIWPEPKVHTSQMIRKVLNFLNQRSIDLVWNQCISREAALRTAELFKAE